MVTYKVQLVTADGNTYPLRVEKDQFILDAALESYLNLPYTCYQPWSLKCSHEAAHFDDNIQSRKYKVKESKPADSFQSGQDLLEKLLGEETKRPVLKKTKSLKITSIN